MIIYISVSGSIFHLVSDERGSIVNKKSYKTFCNQTIDVNRTITFTTLTSYNNINNTCSKCLNNILNSIFAPYLDDDPRYIRNQNNGYNNILSYNRERIMGAEIKYRGLLSRRKDPFLSKLKKNARNTK